MPTETWLNAWTQTTIEDAVMLLPNKELHAKFSELLQTKEITQVDKLLMYSYDRDPDFVPYGSVTKSLMNGQFYKKCRLREPTMQKGASQVEPSQAIELKPLKKMKTSTEPMASTAMAPRMATRTATRTATNKIIATAIPTTTLAAPITTVPTSLSVTKSLDMPSDSQKETFPLHFRSVPIHPTTLQLFSDMCANIQPQTNVYVLWTWFANIPQLQYCILESLVKPTSIGLQDALALDYLYQHVNSVEKNKIWSGQYNSKYPCRPWRFQIGQNCWTEQSRGMQCLFEQLVNHMNKDMLVSIVKQMVLPSISVQRCLVSYAILGTLPFVLEHAELAQKHLVPCKSNLPSVYRSFFPDKVNCVHESRFGPMRLFAETIPKDANFQQSVWIQWQDHKPHFVLFPRFHFFNKQPEQISVKYREWKPLGHAIQQCHLRFHPMVTINNRSLIAMETTQGVFYLDGPPSCSFRNVVIVHCKRQTTLPFQHLQNALGENCVVANRKRIKTKNERFVIVDRWEQIEPGSSTIVFLWKSSMDLFDWPSLRKVLCPALSHVYLEHALFKSHVFTVKLKK